MATKQTNIVSNPARHLVFFEGEELVYNYKTDQWSRCTAYDTLGMYSLRGKDRSIGLVRYSSGSVDLQDQLTSYVPQTATIETGAIDLNQGGRCFISGVRPLVNGGTLSVEVATQNDGGDSADWASAQSVNSRTKMANFRKEGRYARTKLTITGGFNTALGADIEFTNAGRI
jgi:hypothetical protein